MTGQLRLILMIATVTIVLNKGICYLAKSSFIMNDLIKTTKYCCSNATVANHVWKFVTGATTTVMIVDYYRGEQLIRAPNQEVRDDLKSLWRERYLITPSDRFEGQIKASGEYMENYLDKQVNVSNSSDEWIVDDESTNSKKKILN